MEREKSNCVEQLDINTAANQFVLDSKPKKHSHMLQLSLKIIPYVELTVVRLNLFPMECTSSIVTTFGTIFNSDYLDMFTTRRSSDTDTDLKKYAHTKWGMALLSRPFSYIYIYLWYMLYICTCITQQYSLVLSNIHFLLAKLNRSNPNTYKYIYNIYNYLVIFLQQRDVRLLFLFSCCCYAYYSLQVNWQKLQFKDLFSSSF